MDRKIYQHARVDYGVYATRRFPKGGAPSSNPSEINSRNPVPVSLHYNSQALGPHANVIRFTYTVPPHRRAKLQGAIAALSRNVAAPSLGSYASYISLIRQASAGKDGNGLFFVVYARSYLQTAGTNVQQQQAGEIDLYEGDVVEGHTEDANAGGTVSYTISAGLIEYDADEKIVGYSGSIFTDSGELSAQQALSSRFGSGGGSGASLPAFGSSSTTLLPGSKI